MEQRLAGTNWHAIFVNHFSYWYTNRGDTNPGYRFHRAITNEGNCLGPQWHSRQE